MLLGGRITTSTWLSLQIAWYPGTRLPLQMEGSQHRTKTRPRAARSSKNSDRSRRPRENEAVTIVSSSSARKSWKQTVQYVCWSFATPSKRPVAVTASASRASSASRLTKSRVQLVTKQISAFFPISDYEGHCMLFEFGACIRRVAVSGQESWENWIDT